MLALVSIYTEWTYRHLEKNSNFDVNEFLIFPKAGFISKFFNKISLKKWWGITCKEEVISTVDQLLNREHLDSCPAWDVARALDRVILASIFCKYLSKEEAIPYWVNAVEIVKSQYKDWREYGEDYINGLKNWGFGENELKDFEQAIQRLLNHKDSPWKLIHWEALTTRS